MENTVVKQQLVFKQRIMSKS